MDRFRPIMMTTLAALMGALPIALGYGADGASRRPLGLVIVGGLIVSQFITLYITPVFISISKSSRRRCWIAPASSVPAEAARRRRRMPWKASLRMTESGCGWRFGAGGARLNPKTEKEAMRAKGVVRLGIGVLGVYSMFLAGCMVGPKYAKPSVTAPPAYKELTPENFKDTDGWKQAQPSDGMLRGKWWEIFGDPGLNSLEEQVSVSNQNIAAAAASYLEARALVGKRGRNTIRR